MPLGLPVCRNLSLIFPGRLALFPTIIKSPLGRPVLGWTSSTAAVHFSSRRRLLSSSNSLDLVGIAIAAKDQTIAAKDESIKFSEQSIAAKDQTIAAKDESIKFSEQSIAAKDQTIKISEQSIAAKDQTIAAKVETIAEKEANIKRLQASFDFNQKTLDARAIMERFETKMAKNGTRVEKWKEFLATHPKILADLKACDSQAIWHVEAQGIYRALSEDIHYSALAYGGDEYLVRISKGMFFSL
jgi:hypothetical protein